MALQSKTITLGAETDSGSGGKNYVANKPVYIKTSSGTLAAIYADINGATEIVQDGLQNRTNSKGQFTFFAEQGDYLAEYEGQQTPLSIYGADYFNSRIDESVAKITADVALSRGYNRKGTFASGFTYELANDVGIDVNGDAWVYTDIDALPITVSAGTTPSEPEYTPVSFSDSESVKNTDGSSAQDTYDATKSLLVAQGLSGNFGFFEKGFTYNEVGDVGIATNGKIYTYVGGDTLPVSVDAGASPLSPDYDVKTFNRGSDIILEDGRSVEEYLGGKKTIYVSPTINDQTANPPIFNTLQSAMDSITDNSFKNKYEIQLLSGIHSAREILLKDYVDIVRSPLSGNQVIVEYNFSPTESFKNRDIFKTAETPYDATDTTPIRCKISGLFIRGENLNYTIHSDFNDSPDLHIEINDCILFNGDSNTTASTADYAFGAGIYGGQKIKCNNTLFYGRYDPSLPTEKQQGSGWIVHNRAAQNKPCSIEFNNCKSLKGFYGGRIVDYGSGQEDIVSINGGVLLGELGNLLCFSNGLRGTVPPSITVIGDVPMTRVALEQKINASGTIYHCDFPVAINGFSRLMIANENMSYGDIVTTNAYGNRAIKMKASTRYKYLTGGVVMNDALSNRRVSIQTSGIAAVNFTPSSIPSNLQVSNSSTVDGEVYAALSGDGVFGTTVVSTGFSETITSGKAWVSLGYTGLKQ